ncbi:hypothetical protein [Celerinatantimonas sp. MCCC 1A17872]|uniref:hypothetical protein n=1 Tax=Celerinatantimonas sp. MCCC 1A17872 TaxID=3177514 RepID=UPI0038C686EB
MTAQTPEKIIINGREQSLYSQPIIPSNCEAIDDLEEILGDPRAIFDAEYKKQFNITDELYTKLHSVESTCCWRQYIGTWQITNSRLYLVKVEGKFLIKQSAPLFADWFSGDLLVADEHCRAYFNESEGWICSSHKCIHVKNGIITTTDIRKNPEFNRD